MNKIQRIPSNWVFSININYLSEQNSNYKINYERGVLSYMSNNTVLSFSFDVMLKEIEKIISCMVVKRDYVAKQYETTEILDNANIYFTALHNYQ